MCQKGDFFVATIKICNFAKIFKLQIITKINNMKRINFVVLVASVLTLFSCSDENPWVSANGEGHISPLVLTDGTVESALPLTRGQETLSVPEADKFAVKLAKEDGTYSESWDAIGLFPTDKSFGVGAYTMEAYYGDFEKEGFESPYFYGSSDFLVKEDETSEVKITASLANTMVSIDYTDAFKAYFKQYSTQLHSKGGDFITFLPGETRPAYLKPGQVSIVVSLTKQNGVSTTFQPTSIATEAKHHYHITFDVNDGEIGEAQLSIKFDDSLSKEDVVINLSDDLMLSPEPSLTAVGFVHNESLSILEGTPAEAKFNAIAMGGLQEVILTTQSEQLHALGWPDEIDLMAASDSQKALLQTLGLKVAGIWNNPDKMAIVDMSNVFENLNGESSNQFTLMVKDKLTKVSEPLVMKVNTIPVEVSVKSVEEVMIESTQTEMVISYNGYDFSKNIAIEAQNLYGAWINCAINELTQLSESEYKLNITIPASLSDIPVRVKYKGEVKTEATINVKGVILAVDDVDIWATKATLKVSKYPTDINLSDLDIYVAAGNGNYTKYSNATIDATNKTVLLNGLSAGTAYKVIATELDALEPGCSELSFKTESALQIENAGFEDWSSYDWEFNHNGSLAGQSSPMKYYKPWSAGSSDKWWDSNTTTTLINSLTIGYTYFKTYPLVQYSVDSHSGGKSAQITVANVGNGNSVVATTGSWYVGELFLGAGNDGTKGGWSRSSEGHSFEARPTSLTFWYEYVPYSSSDTFSAELWLKAADGTIIATASLPNGGSASEWKSVELPLNYTVYNKKAASIFIAFKASTSSDHSCSAGGDWLEIAGSSISKEDKYRIKLSATLRVDDIQLNY